MLNDDISLTNLDTYVVASKVCVCVFLKNVEIHTTIFDPIHCTQIVVEQLFEVHVLLSTARMHGLNFFSHETVENI